MDQATLSLMLGGLAIWTTIVIALYQALFVPSEIWALMNQETVRGFEKVGDEWIPVPAVMYTFLSDKGNIKTETVFSNGSVVRHNKNQVSI